MGTVCRKGGTGVQAVILIGDDLNLLAGTSCVK